MACGCAVATTDCGGNREYARNEETALVSDPDDLASLENNVLRLLSDEELRVRIALALFFEYNSLSMWLKRRRISVKTIKAYFNQRLEKVQ
jgi:glycosyltransferase involved in cell wall biosynthesis